MGYELANIVIFVIIQPGLILLFYLLWKKEKKKNKKDTGEIRISFPKHTPVNASFDDVLTAYAEAQNFNGVCSEVKRKNL
jgi:hypothetical protein